MPLKAAAFGAKSRPTLMESFEDAVHAPAAKPVDKVDQLDVNDPQANVPYLQEIHRHYRDSEVSHPALAIRLGL